MTTGTPLSEAIAAVSGFLVSDVSLGATLDRVAELVQQAVEPTIAVGLTLVDDRWRPATFISTGRVSSAVDEAQYVNQEGPCLDSYREQRPIRVDDTSQTADRWPRFSLIAIENGVLSSLSLPLTAGGETYGALNLYAGSTHAFTEQHLEEARLFATQASVVVGNARLYWGAYELAEDLKVAMQSRASIEQAKGIIMATRHCTPDEAFELLATASQRANSKVRDMAARMVEGYSRPTTDRPADRPDSRHPSPGPPRDTGR